MKMSVTKIPYEIVGAGVPIAEEFYSRVEAATTAQWSVVESLGAAGFRPGWRGRIRSLFFRDVPQGFRQIGRDGDLIECVPRKGTKSGKAAASAIDSAPKIPDQMELADKFGWGGRSPCDGRLLYFATATRLSLPSVRYLLRLPREDDDGFVVPPELSELRQSEYMAAFAAHNAAVEMSA